MKYAKQLVVILLIITFSVELPAQNRFRVMFYNVENLFDIKDDTLKSDEDFLPEGTMRWTGWKYWEKLKNISRVITAVGEMHSPVLVGLCEVENDSVVFDLTRRAPLRAQQYEYLVTNSPDRRGIDVALLYQRDQFRLIRSDEYRITFSDPTVSPTRNILHAIGETLSGDTLDVFVCHFPSRRGGQMASEHKRLDAAQLLREKIDTLFSIRQKANIVIMGDFNDHPDNRSLAETLNARDIRSPISSRALYNLFLHRLRERNFGTCKYAGRWEILDQFIVSGNLLSPENRVRVCKNEAHVFSPDFLLEDDQRYSGKRPYRTNLGPRYIGGFSDHLPVFFDLEVSP